VLNAITDDPLNEIKWIDLFIFTKYVFSLPHGIPTHTRTKAISKHIQQRLHDLDTLSLQSRLDLLVQETSADSYTTASKRSATTDEALARRVAQKLEEGNFRGAVNTLRSEDSFDFANAFNTV